MNSIKDGEGVPVLHVDRHLCVVCKPAGTPVQPDRTGDPDLLGMVSDQLGDGSIGLVHRLDRPVSGAVVMARTPETLRGLSELFRKRRVDKRYWAIVQGRPVPGSTGGWALLEHGLSHDGRNKRARVHLVHGGHGVARLHYRILVQGERLALLEVCPEGGAFHQIRAQLGAMGHPIRGDVKYGARRGERDRSIALHARTIGFVHPVTGKRLRVHAPVPGGGLWETLVASLSGPEEEGPPLPLEGA